MEKQTIIRGAAIVVAGIAASTFGAQHLLGGKQSPATDTQASMQAQSPQVMGAGVMGNLSTQSPSDALHLEDTSFTALSDGKRNRPALETGTDFAPKLALAEGVDPVEAPVDCTPHLVSRPAVDALIELSLDAPCHANERLVVSHDDLAFSAYTTDNGSFSAYIPALSSDAKIDVFLSDDIFLQTAVQIDDVDAHARVVLQWSGDAAFSLHAYHRDARYGEDGHIHALKPFDAALDEAFLISLGENRGPEPMLSEIYSIPSHMAASSRVELELQFSAQQCGETVSAFVLNTGSGVSAEVKEASFALPGCPAENGALVMELPMITPQHAELPFGTEMMTLEIQP